MAKNMKKFPNIALYSAAWFPENVTENSTTTFTENRATKNNEFDLFALPPWRIALWSVFFGLLIVASVVGNGTVIWTIMSDVKMRSISNCFLV